MALVHGRGPLGGSGDTGPRVSESRSGEALPWGPRARPSDGGGQAGGQLRCEEGSGRDDQDSAQRAAGGRGQADMATLGGVRPGGFGVRPCSGQTPGIGRKLGRHPREAQPKSAPRGKSAHGLGIHGRHRAPPHHRGPGAHGPDGSGLAVAGREAPSAGSVVPAPSPQSLQLRAPSLREHGPPPKAQALPGASGHSP